MCALKKQIVVWPASLCQPMFPSSATFLDLARRCINLGLAVNAVRPRTQCQIVANDLQMPAAVRLLKKPQFEAPCQQEAMLLVRRGRFITGYNGVGLVICGILQLRFMEKTLSRFFGWVVWLRLLCRYLSLWSLVDRGYTAANLPLADSNTYGVTAS